ncbi:MAG: lipid II flippase MurJ [Candidatus Zixiibacteriota bacterium]
MRPIPQFDRVAGWLGGPLRRAGIIVIGLTIVGKGVGFVREVVIAAVYGTSAPIDLYLAAVAVPAIIGTVLYHALPNALIPLFSEHRAPHPTGRKVAVVLLVLMAVISSAIWVTAPWVSSLTSKGFEASAQAEVAILLRIVCAAILFVTAESLMRSWLLARKRFAWSGASQIWQSVVMIAAIAIFPEGGSRVLAWGYFLGSVASLLWSGLGFRDRATPILATEAGATLLHAHGLSWVALVLITDTLSQFYTLIDRHFAAFMPTGSIAAVQYAGVLISAPLGIAGSALASVVFPYLSDAVSANDRGRAARIFTKGVDWALVVAVPSAVIGILLSQPLTQVVFERGAFQSSSRESTALAIAVLAWGMIPSILGGMAGRFAYARTAWRPLLAGAVVGLAGKYAVAALTAEKYGIAGIAAGTVIGYSLTAAVLFAAVPSDVIQQHWITWARRSFILAGAFLASSALGMWIFRLLPGRTLAGSVAALFVAVALGSVLAYAGSRALNRVPKPA